MATTVEFVIILTSILISIATASNSSSPPPPPPPTLKSQDYHATILSALGFQELSTAATASLSNITTPITIFAPTDSSLLTCPSCFISFLLQEHSVPGLYPLGLLSTLAFGTKIETLAPTRCLTVTSAAKVFINGAEITRPGVFNDGHIMVHGLQGVVSHLSPLSCDVERMISLSFPLPPPPVSLFFIMRLMLKDTVLNLRNIGGYGVLALALRKKYTEMLDLQAMTVFALDDASIFTQGHVYVSNLRLHIVPNMRLMAADMLGLPAGTELPTMEWEQKLVVTTAGGGGPLVPMRINYVKIKSVDLLYNSRIVVHGLSLPFRRINHPAAESQFRRSESQGQMVAPTSGIGL